MEPLICWLSPLCWRSTVSLVPAGSERAGPQRAPWAREHMGSTESGPDARAFSENTSCHNPQSVRQVRTGQGLGGSNAGTSQALLWIAGSRLWGRDHLASLH